MAPKAKNKVNKGLPTRWRMKGTAYYFRVPPGMEHLWDNKTEFKLGDSLAEAHYQFAKRFESTTNRARTINDLLDAYVVEKLPTLAANTRRAQPYLITPLRLVFGTMSIEDVKPSDCYQFVDQSAKRSSAIHSIQVLQSAFALAVQKGWMDQHPLRGQMRFERRAKRKVHLEEWEIVEALSMESKRKRGSVLAIQAYIRIKLLTGARRVDILRIREADLRSDGIYINPSKTENSTNASIIVKWTPALIDAVAIAKKARPLDISPFLFCNRKGEAYVDEQDSDSGWKSMWQRFNQRLLEETDIDRPWTEALMRSRCAMDSATLEEAQKLLAHADAATTKRHYRQKAELVNPVDRSFSNESMGKK